MVDLPTVLRGIGAIAAHLGESNRVAQHLFRAGHLPTWRVGGTPYATPSALDDWQALRRHGALPTK